ncbi:MAG TPA: molybdate ABC transporter substrate-binding protein [Myxococcota bacterium]|jgi:molybdate transport system substrate-binding protein
MSSRFAFALVALSLAGCTPKTPLHVLGAQSLESAFQAAGHAYDDAHKDTRVDTSFAGSQILVTQVEQGAPADVIATADTKTMDDLVQKHLVDAPVLFAHNKLVVVVPAKNPAHITSITDISKPGIKLVLAGEKVPAGNYARTALRALGIDHDALKNVVSNEDSVAGVMTKVSLGEADAGIAYATDVKASGGKTIAWPFPPGVDVSVAYPIAVTSSSQHKAEAAAFIAFVSSGPGADALRAAGFSVP